MSVQAKSWQLWVDQSKQHYIMKNALHNFADTVDPDGYYNVISSFLRDFTEWKPL